MNPTRPRPRAASLLALIAIAAGLAAPAANAQLQVQMTLNKKDFVAYESVKATVTVANRAGQDVVLDGPSGLSWLTFDVRKNGRLVSPQGGRTAVGGAFVLAAGKSITKTINVASIFPMTDFGNYTINASVYFPPTRDYFASNKSIISVSDPRTFWKQSIGVSEGRDKLASFREYSLLDHRSQTRSDLFVRLRDTKGGRVYCTYSLGRYLAVRKPQATVDAQNRLHVLHMVGPRIYQHSQVAPDGSFLGAELYREGPRDRPTMMIDPGGVVQVRGGEPYDPRTAAAPVAGDAPRLASDRPQGLPR